MLYTPNAWVHIADDNTITLISARSEMGPGRLHLDADADRRGAQRRHAQIKVAIAPPSQALRQRAARRPAAHRRLDLGARRLGEAAHAGAQVREMLISAAADEWKVDRSTLKAENGKVIGKGKSATYGQLAAAASKLPVPEKVALKDPRTSASSASARKRLDTPAKVNGTAEFGIDVKLPGMVYASLEQCPVIGGTVKSFDAAKAKAMPGVIDVVQIPDGVAVVADTYWHAKKAREALTVVWDEGAGAALNDKAMLEGIRAGAPATRCCR
jgi:isoquinoline 1-oxidoreductase beta subunit